MPNSNDKNVILPNQSKTTHNNNQLTNSVIQYIQSTNNHLDSLIANKNNISISKEDLKTFKRLATALKLLDSLWFAKSKKSSSNNKVHLEPSVNFNFVYLKQILNHNLSQLKVIADKDKLIIELIQLEEKMIAKIG